MTSSIEQFRKTVDIHMLDRPRVTGDQLRDQLRKFHDFHAMSYPPGLTDEQIEGIAVDIEVSQGIKAGFGSVIDGKDFEPWLDDTKSTIEHYYWPRYKTHLAMEGLPRDVITSIDRVTDQILGRLGNPAEKTPWDRRGMVVGRVQSGKTANYIGLACKAADAGYRLVIVIAGINNNLRNQTQSRIDEGFIGRDTGKLKEKKSNGIKNAIGVGYIDSENTPVSLTNTIRDFNRQTATTNTSQINSYVVPVILVIKKNPNTLANLIEWLRDNSTKGDREMIDQPMLLIDDEADNASINTKYGNRNVTKINGQIRDLLNMFERSSYVGYTATPFANIFIDPDQNDEMYNEDLFPRDFIFGLDMPSNYFGPTKIFVDGLPDQGRPKWLRYIFDNEDVLPISHKKTYEIYDLPPSLVDALRAFLLARTIRNIRGDSHKHCSMLVNASRFTRIQAQLRNRLHEVLEDIKNAVRIHSSQGMDALNDHEINELHRVWRDEYIDAGPDWCTIQEYLYKAISSAKVVEVNSNANDLDYSLSRNIGQTVVAVGGFSLSRGLTLEGLVVTWFLRNTMMYDTLMQMGRWFGYRYKYEDICRIWMPSNAIEWYAFIANAAEELHDELSTMEKAKATPQMFGLAVRSHPASLLVTARNKMGSSRKITTLIGLSNSFVETSRISIKLDDITSNIQSAKWFVQKLLEGGLIKSRKDVEDIFVPKGDIFIPKVPVEFVDEFLAGWRNPRQSIITNPDLIRKYIRARSKDELKTWDVLIPSLVSGNDDDTLGVSISPPRRAVDANDLKNEFMSFGGKKMRLSSRGVEKAGVSIEDIKDVESAYLKRPDISGKEVVNFPDKIYRERRVRGLFILHYVRATIREEEAQSDCDLLPTDPVVGWSISLPKSSRPQELVEYVVNSVGQREMFGVDDEDEDQESYYEAQ